MVQPDLDGSRTWRRRGERMEGGGVEKGRTGHRSPDAFESDAFECQEPFGWELCRQSPAVKNELLSCQALWWPVRTRS